MVVIAHRCGESCCCRAAAVKAARRRQMQSAASRPASFRQPLPLLAARAPHRTRGAGDACGFGVAATPSPGVVVRQSRPPSFRRNPRHSTSVLLHAVGAGPHHTTSSPTHTQSGLAVCPTAPLRLQPAAASRAYMPVQFARTFRYLYNLQSTLKYLDLGS